MHRFVLCSLALTSTATAQPAKPKPKPTLAVVEVIERHEECTGAGGEHYVLRIHDGRNPPRLAHAGGHASYLGLLGRVAKPRSTFYVAELEMLDSRTGAGATGWPCLDRMPAVDAAARRLVRAKSRADAEQLRARLATTGLRQPTPAWGTTVIDPPKE